MAGPFGRGPLNSDDRPGDTGGGSHEVATAGHRNKSVIGPVANAGMSGTAPFQTRAKAS